MVTGVFLNKFMVGGADNQLSMLEVESLTKDFGGFLAVDSVDMSIKEGEVRGLFGPNGAGKTTLFNLITGEFEPTDGKVTFQGENITGAPPERIARLGIGRSFQIVELFPELTVRENLRLAVRDESRTLRSIFGDTDYDNRIREIAEIVKLDDVLDREASNLSHGEKRYLDIGMVLALDPDLILFDEPAAGLNQSEFDTLEAILTDLRGEYTMLIVEHNVEFVLDIVDRLTVLHRGKILDEGTPEEIRENTKVQEVYLGE